MKKPTQNKGPEKGPKESNVVEVNFRPNAKPTLAEILARRLRTLR